MTNLGSPCPLCQSTNTGITHAVYDETGSHVVNKCHQCWHEWEVGTHRARTVVVDQRPMKLDYFKRIPVFAHKGDIIVVPNEEGTETAVKLLAEPEKIRSVDAEELPSIFGEWICEVVDVEENS